MQCVFDLINFEPSDDGMQTLEADELLPFLEFVSAKYLSPIEEKKLRVMFDIVDASGDNEVSWVEFMWFVLFLKKARSRAARAPLRTARFMAHTPHPRLAAAAQGKNEHDKKTQDAAVGAVIDLDLPTPEPRCPGYSSDVGVDFPGHLVVEVRTDRTPNSVFTDHAVRKRPDRGQVEVGGRC